ncbi:MAG TPA: hypothetical protein VK638_37660 [Edaphobacter sp.]|nr:hypothetical protein [Edaphobacter sp.]
MNRRSFVGTAATSVGALATLGIAGSDAEAQLVYTKSDWKLGEFNQLAKNPARVKQVYDIIPIAEGRFLNNIKNSLNGLRFGFGIPEEQIKVVAALHGPANMLNYDDVIWSKYKIGAWLKVTDPSTGQPAGEEPLLRKQGRDVAALQHRKPGQPRFALPGHEHSCSAAPGREDAQLPYGARGAGSSADRAQQPDATAGRNRKGDAGAHAAGGAGCSVNGRSDRASADGRTLQLHNGIGQQRRNHS